jgi:hypothetical protein
MALLSFAGSPHGGRQRLLPEWNTQPKITPVLIIDHTIVGSVDGAFAHFRDNTGIEAHFGIRGRRSGSRDGEIEQWMDTGREADANLNANDKAISIETEDNGAAPIEPWSAAQIQSLKWLHNKLVAVHPTILRREAGDCDGPGLGYHTKLGAPSCWTPVAKTCPGSARISQWGSVLLPAFLNPAPPELPKGDDDMFILRADGDRELKLVANGSATKISNDDRKAHTAAGVQELNYTGAPGAYDAALELATSTPQALRNTLVRAELALASGQDNAEFKSGDPTIPDGDLPTDERLVRALHDAAGVAHLTAPPPV